MAEQRERLPALLRAATFEPAQVERIWTAIAARRARRTGAAPARAFGVGLALSGITALAVGVAIASLPQLRTLPAAHEPASSAAVTLTRSDGSMFGAVEASASAPARVVLSDGSAVDVSPGGRVEPVALTARGVVLRLQRGTARFAVRPGGPRRWAIEAGPARVEVVGTRFEVTREPTATRVRVEHGKVRVRGRGLPPDGIQLTAGEELSVDVEPRTETVTRGAPIEPPAALARGPIRAAPERAPAAAKKTEAATATTRTATTTRTSGTTTSTTSTVSTTTRDLAPPPDVESLLLQADRLRVAHDYAAAARVLERALHEHAGDPRAALAAFTLGRLREHALGDASGAATAYAQALALGLSGTLAHDARAHLARSLLAGGRRDAAILAAGDYLAHHPHGADADAMRALVPETTGPDRDAPR